MTDKKLVVLGGIAVLMVILAVITSNVPEKKGGQVIGATYLVQGVDPDSIATIEVKSGDDTVTLKRKKGQFVVDQKSNYPAQASKINSLISDVLDIKTIEMFTKNPANHTDLGVTEENAAYVVRFLKPDGEELTGVVIGRNKEQGQGLFVRLTSDDRVHVTLDRLNISTKAIGYVDQSLISVTAAEIEWVKSAGDGAKYDLRKSDDGNIVLDKMPEGKKLRIAKRRAFSMHLPRCGLTMLQRLAPGNLPSIENTCAGLRTLRSIRWKLPPMRIKLISSVPPSLLTRTRLRFSGAARRQKKSLRPRKPSSSLVTLQRSLPKSIRDGFTRCQAKVPAI